MSAHFAKKRSNRYTFTYRRHVHQEQLHLWPALGTPLAPHAPTLITTDPLHLQLAGLARLPVDRNHVREVVFKCKGPRGRALEPPEPPFQFPLAVRDEATPLGISLVGRPSDRAVLRDEEEGATGIDVVFVGEQRLRELCGRVDKHLCWKGDGAGGGAHSA